MRREGGSEGALRKEKWDDSLLEKNSSNNPALETTPAYTAQPTLPSLYSAGRLNKKSGSRLNLSSNLRHHASSAPGGSTIAPPAASDAKLSM